MRSTRRTCSAILATQPQNVALVPPDPKRQFVSKKQYKAVFENGTQADGHGFDYVDPAQNAASNGSAGYYSWSPKPGVRFISLDTVSEAGRDRAVGRRQHRRPAVPVAARGS